LYAADLRRFLFVAAGSAIGARSLTRSVGCGRRARDSGRDNRIQRAQARD
jgi:hypothetical protein